MKKTGLFKILMCMILGIIIISWIVPASFMQEGTLSELGMYRIGFFDIFQLLFGAFQFKYFIQVLIFILCVGAFYGVLTKTGKYRAWIEKIAASFKGIEYIFLVCTALVLVALSSVFSYGLLLFMFIPFLIGIILSMGYEKITAFIATFGAVLIGEIGNTIGYNINGVINEAVGTTLTSGLVYKLIMLFIPLGLLIFYLVKSKHNGIKNLDDKSEEELFIGEKSSNKYSVVPIIVALSLLFVFLVIGCTNWSDTFEIEAFTKAHDAVMAFKIKGFEIFKYLFGNIGAFGTWNYAEMSVLLILLALVVGRFFRMKHSEILNNMAQGAKRILKPALLVILSYTVLYFAGNVLFYPTIAKFLLNATSKFNVFFSALDVILGSALHVDMTYVIAYVVPQIAAQDADATVIMLLCQGLYGVTMLAAPTSILLILGLSYLGIPYTEWIKKTWKYILIILAVVVAIIFASMLI